MRLFITTAAAVLALAGVASAQAASPAKVAPAKASRGQYISVAGGFIGKTDYDYKLFPGYKLDADVDAGAQGVIAWGATLDGPWRVELALGYRSQDLKGVIVPAAGVNTDGTIKTLTLDMNTYYDFQIAGPVKPYLGAGLGVASVKIDDGILDDKGDGLALRAIAGASVTVSPRVTLFAEGRYERIGSLKIETTVGATKTKSTIDMSGPAALVGARFGF